MKFGALLRSSAQEVPELQGLFECYKQLKKRLKRLPAKASPATASAASSSVVREHQRAFVSLLVADIQAFNETFVEREEQSVIQLSLIEDRAACAHDAEEVAAVYKSFVDFHGQTLMLVHWSILAYTSVLKILKKHHKRTGLQVQEFSMQQLLSQPFCSVELISGLVRKAEAKAQDLAGRLNPGAAQASLSCASPASSPVAELISAARASVKEIANSAAQGNAALDEHLRDQPTSSDEASAEGGEAEVLSGPSRAKGECKSAEQQSRIASPAAPAPVDDSEVGSKRQAVSDVAGRPAKHGKRLEPGAEPVARLNGHRRHHGVASAAADLTRAGSMAGDSEAVLRSDNLAGVPRNAEEWPAKCEHCSRTPPGAEEPEKANGGSGGAAPPAAASTAAAAASRQPSLGESDSGSGRSPQLTMGQGWGRGGSQNILRQTQMALGLWEQLHYTAATPSTVVPPLQDTKGARGSANSAA